MANIAQGKAECYICHETLTKCYTKEAAVLEVVYYILHLLTEQTFHNNVSVNTFMEQTNDFL